jgi:hypothetical protein
MKHPLRRLAPLLTLLAVLPLACATTGGARPELPAHAAADPALAELDFLAGHWVAENPNGTVNEEVWTPVRGHVAVGTFRQVRLDGDCAFVEFSQIVAEDGTLVLRLRHLHRRLEIAPGREELSVFRLVSLEPGKVVFAGTGAAAEVASVTYERVGPDELHQAIGFAEGSAESAFVTRYTRDRP